MTKKKLENPSFPMVRGVAQPGSASALGAEGRWFESSLPDHSFQWMSLVFGGSGAIKAEHSQLAGGTAGRLLQITLKTMWVVTRQGFGFSISPAVLANSGAFDGFSTAVGAGRAILSDNQ